jgi:hypothetical protein
MAFFNDYRYVLDTIILVVIILKFFEENYLDEIVEFRGTDFMKLLVR